MNEVVTDSSMVESVQGDQYEYTRWENTRVWDSFPNHFSGNKYSKVHKAIEALPLEWVRSYAIKTKLFELIDQRFEDIVNDLEWADQSGYLIKVRMATDQEDNFQVGSVDFIGLGKTPIDALLFDSSQDNVRGDLPVGLRYDKNNSFYKWITLGPKRRFRRRKLEVFTVHAAGLDALQRMEVIQMANNDFKRSYTDQFRSQIYAEALKTLEKKISDSAKLQKATQLNNTINSSNAQIRGFQNDLSRSLQESENSGRFFESLNKLSAVISLANFAMLANSVSPEVANNLRGVTSAKEMRTIVTEYSRQVDIRIEEHRTDIRITEDVILRNRLEMSEIFRESGIPSSFNNNYILP